MHSAADVLEAAGFTVYDRTEASLLLSRVLHDALKLKVATGRSRAESKARKRIRARRISTSLEIAKNIFFVHNLCTFQNLK